MLQTVVLHRIWCLSFRSGRASKRLPPNDLRLAETLRVQTDYVLLSECLAHDIQEWERRRDLREHWILILIDSDRCFLTFCLRPICQRLKLYKNALGDPTIKAYLLLILNMHVQVTYKYGGYGYELIWICLIAVDLQKCTVQPPGLEQLGGRWLCVWLSYHWAEVCQAT